MSVVNSTPLLAAAGGEYQISRSVRLRSSASAYLNRTFSSGANETTSTLSLWVKRGKIGAQQTLMGVAGGGSNEADLFFDGGDTLTFASWNGGSRPLGTITTSAVFRDPSAWYHIVFVVDTTNATASNRLRLYVNGLLQTIGSSSYPSQNAVWYWNGAYAHRLGAYANTLTAYFDGYLTDVNFIDGQALTPDSFGETDAVTGVWKPKKYAGTYGTNGFYLNFSDNSAATAAAIGKDSSGNGNNWTPNNISVTSGVTYDSMLDTPTPYADGGNGRGNYAVWNPLDKVNGTLRDANLTSATNSQNYGVRGTIAFSSGKHYWEFTVNTASPTNHHGVWDVTEVMGSNYVGQTVGSWGVYDANGNKRNNGSYTAYGSGFTTNDIGMVAVDMDSGKIWWGKNGTWFASGAPASGTNEAFSNLSGRTVSPAQLQQSDCSYNFGQRPFTYTPPTGFKALNTQNLPEPTIKKGNEYFDATLYTGNGSSGGQSVVNAGTMQPDFVWLKARSSAGEHELFDAVRGGTKYLVSNNTNAEQTGAGITFNSNGFSLAGAQYNDNAMTVVGWQWKASGSTVSNTDGSITSTVSANTTAGFSVVTYSGAGTTNSTVGHGLGVAPSMIIVKRRNSADNWIVGHASLGWTGNVFLNLTNAFYNDSSNAPWADTAPTSTVFSVSQGSGGWINETGSNYVAYCFSEVPGYSKFGSYTGNGSADGPFVYCGFRPRWVMIKRTDVSGQGWIINDSSRDSYNVTGQDLYANTSAAEVNESPVMDLTSNGFKMRNNYGGFNTNGGTYIFLAFAEHPAKYSLAR